MSLNEYFRILRRWGWILLLMAVLTAGSAFVFSKVQTPVYKSTIYLGVLPARPDLGLTQSAKTLLRLYVSVINTETFAARVINDPQLQLDRTPESLLGDVTIASDESRFVIQIDVESQDPALGNRIAQKWADLFVQWRTDENARVRREDQVNAFVLDPPKVSLDRPKTQVNTLAGGILGLLIGGLIVFVLEYVESGVIRTSDDVDRFLELSVLGAIPPGEMVAHSMARRPWALGARHAPNP